MKIKLKTIQRNSYAFLFIAIMIRNNAFGKYSTWWNFLLKLINGDENIALLVVIYGLYTLLLFY